MLVPLRQNILDSVEYRSGDDDSSKHVQRLAERMVTKLSAYFDVLNHSANLIQDFKHHSKKLCYVNVPCIYISENGSYEESYNNSTVDFNNLPLSILNLTEGEHHQ
ncbi:hypothetical protein J6590_034712 [Homalodisca vitripennis]|nr:hypothetical protein J6590_034712 [Homalodisca vitripennis]